MNYSISHVDTCLPDFFGGHHLPYFSIPIDNTTLYSDVKKEMLDWQTTDHLDIDINDDAFKLAVEELFTDVKLERVVDATLDNMDEDYDSVCMFFVIETSDFTYQELTPAAQQKALEDWAQDEPYDNWWECLEEYLREDMKLRGIEIDDVQFSGFYSQGDGSSFVGNVDLLHFMNWDAQQGEASHHLATTHKEAYLSMIPFNGDKSVDYEWIVVIKRNSHHYSHENTVSTNVEYDYYGDGDDDMPENAVIELEQALDDIMRGYMRSYYKHLEDEYDYLTSAEAFIEACDANEYLFNVDGDMQ
jgi:hypothetical protein